MTTQHPEAFEPITVGAMQLRNRIVMAPMTRNRAYDTTPTEDMAEYYAQRAGAGLIITEGAQPSASGQGYPATPGLHSPEQVDAWRRVTTKVHEEGGLIAAQIMHSGRIGHPSTTDAAGNLGLRPVGPSPVRAAGQVPTPEGLQDHVQPTELTQDGIGAIISDFVDAARKAREAGFDAVEVHGANGYLLHQFLAENANLRTDAWGGSVANRIRLAVEVTRAVADAIGADRTGIRLSPNIGLGDLREPDYADVYTVLIRELDTLGLAYLHFVEAGDPEFTPVARALWNGRLILNPAGGELATQSDRLSLIAEGKTDLVSFGRLFIANPDLVERLRAGSDLALPDMSKAYGGDSTGYTDYPRLAELEPSS